MESPRPPLSRNPFRWPERSLAALFVAGIAVLVLTFVLGFTLRAPLDSFVPGSREASDVARKFVGSVSNFWATLGLVLILTLAYLACLLACARGFPWMFAAAIAGSAIVGASLIPMRPLSSPDGIHLAADVRTLWLHGQYPAVYDGRPAAIDDPIARAVKVYRDAPSGYGPVAYAIGGLPLPFVGDSLPANIGGQKVVGLAFLVLAAALTGFLARSLGRSPGLAAAIVGLNPVFLWEFAGEGHNDAMMVVFALTAVLFVVRARPRDRLAGIGFGALAVLTKYGLAIAAPIVAAHWWPRYRKAIAIASVVLGALVAVALLTDIVPTGGAAGPATAIAPTNPWHVLQSITIEPTSEWRKAWVGISYFWLLLLLAYIVYEAPLGSRRDLVSALGLFFAGYAFGCFPALLPWYTVWFLPFTILTGKRWLTVGSVVLVSGMFVPIFATGADASGVRMSIATSVSTSVVLLWLAAGLTALSIYRRDRTAQPAVAPAGPGRRQQQRAATRGRATGRARG